MVGLPDFHTVMFTTGATIEKVIELAFMVVATLAFLKYLKHKD